MENHDILHYRWLGLLLRFLARLDPIKPHTPGSHFCSGMLTRVQAFSSPKVLTKDQFSSEQYQLTNCILTDSTTPSGPFKVLTRWQICEEYYKSSWIDSQFISWCKTIQFARLIFFLASVASIGCQSISLLIVTMYTLQSVFPLEVLNAHSHSPLDGGVGLLLFSRVRGSFHFYGFRSHYDFGFFRELTLHKGVLLPWLVRKGSNHLQLSEVHYKSTFEIWYSFWLEGGACVVQYSRALSPQFDDFQFFFWGLHVFEMGEYCWKWAATLSWFK